MLTPMNIWQLYTQLFLALVLGFILLQADLFLGSLLQVPVTILLPAGILCTINRQFWIALVPLIGILAVGIHIQLHNIVPWLLIISCCPLVLQLSKQLLNSTSAPLACALSTGTIIQLIWLIGNRILLYPYFAYTIALIFATIVVAIICDRSIMGRRGNRSWNF